MTQSLVMPMIHIGIGVFLVVLGVLVKVKQWAWLISGYNTSSAQEKATYDTKALCNGVGNFMYLLGFTLFIASIGFLADTIWIAFIGWGLFMLSIIVFLIYANTGGRYKK